MRLVTLDTIRLFFIGLPVLVAGTLLGWSLYGKLNEVAFRKVVLALLLVSGSRSSPRAGDFRIWHFATVSAAQRNVCCWG